MCRFGMSKHHFLLTIIICIPHISSPIKADGELITGALGPDNGGLSVEQGYDAARHCGLNIIATLKKQLGDLDRVEQVVKVCIIS